MGSSRRYGDKDIAPEIGLCESEGTPRCIAVVRDQGADPRSYKAKHVRQGEEAERRPTCSNELPGSGDKQDAGYRPKAQGQFIGSVHKRNEAPVVIARR